MNPRLQRGLQVVLTAVAGFGNTIAFLQLSAVYAAFMTGNSITMGIALSHWHGGELELLAAVVACFVAGVVVGTLVGETLDRFRPAGVLLLVAHMLAAAAALSRHGQAVAGVLVLTVGMGTINTAFNRPGHPGVGLTYMTGTLVRIGQTASDALRGGGWMKAVPDLLLWLGLVVGAALGAVAFAGFGPIALVAAAAAVLLLSGVAAWAAPPLSSPGAQRP